MDALSTFLRRLLFILACVLGWVVFPMLLLGGGLALLVYASIAEVISSLVDAAKPLFRNRIGNGLTRGFADRLDARKTADRLCGPLRW